MRVPAGTLRDVPGKNFPSFSEGLSLRVAEASAAHLQDPNFPSFSEGLSLRAQARYAGSARGRISLPFRRDFH